MQHLTMLNAKTRRRDRVIMNLLKFLKLLKIHPWLHPDFSFVYLAFTPINCLQCKIVHLASYYLFFGLHNS